MATLVCWNNYIINPFTLIIYCEITRVGGAAPRGCAHAQTLLKRVPEGRVILCVISRDMWIKLEEIYQSEGPAREATLFKMPDTGDVPDHLRKFFDIVDKLSEMEINQWEWPPLNFLAYCSKICHFPSLCVDKKKSNLLQSRMQRIAEGFSLQIIVIVKYLSEESY
ncbi:hypothetical protein AVEN_78386-1 [Araneus ventricosus]|uniref:Uncharacterized protein n=1 Tax=Araneus ventricosus TaxID=182803 RepID=A0A4Y2U7E0_ARAVE|nr:hypothetical protein AVEN_78386-1 [Araneus ventricosus]